MENCSDNNYNGKWLWRRRRRLLFFFGTVFGTIEELENLLTELRCTVDLAKMLLPPAGRYFRQRKQR